MKILLSLRVRAVPSAHGGAWLRLGRWRPCRWLSRNRLGLSHWQALRPVDLVMHGLVAIMSMCCVCVCDVGVFAPVRTACAGCQQLFGSDHGAR